MSTEPRTEAGKRLMADLMSSRSPLGPWDVAQAIAAIEDEASDYERCEACGDDYIAPCSDHVTDAEATAQLRTWGYSEAEVGAWLAAHADRPGAA